MLPWMVADAGNILSKCQKVVTDGHHFERVQGKRPHHEFFPLGEKVLARPISTAQNEPQKQIWRLAQSENQQCGVLDRYS